MVFSHQLEEGGEDGGIVLLTFDEKKEPGFLCPISPSYCAVDEGFVADPESLWEIAKSEGVPNE
jgi:hypothetical protein